MVPKIDCAGKPVHGATKLIVLANSFMVPTTMIALANPYKMPIDMINDWEGERVTIWKTILSLFGRVGANLFTGAGWFGRLVDSR